VSILLKNYEYKNPAAGVINIRAKGVKSQVG
jgi:hypothetical protein